MKIHTDIWQGSPEWELKRSQFITASEADNLISPSGAIREGKMPHSFLMRKVAELWMGAPLPSAEFWDGAQGNFLEEYARPAFELETGLEVKQVGFIENGRCGCSPDGIIVGQDCGLEIKSPRLDTHCKYLLGGKVPEEYCAQVQFSLFVTGWPAWKFFSFRRGMPPLALTVEPHPNIQQAIGEAVEGFLERLDKALARLKELNGGVRPVARTRFVPPPRKEPEIEVENLN